MTNQIATSPNMIRLLLTYVSFFASGVAVAYGVTLLIAGLSNQGVPIYILALIVPMLAAMQTGGAYVRQTGRAAGFGYSLYFGVLSTLLVLATLLIIWQLGGLDAFLREIDPYAMQNDMAMRALSPLLILAGGFALFCNTLMFWAMTRGEMKRKERLAAKGR
ncbi:MAG: ABZJ_00895 family protein [Paracoccus sp. (in: a-proteobacteria)]|nr:ABZJ_00895 family protein [Paracoccus sp. (in: a-proteobacteria)]